MEDPLLSRRPVVATPTKLPCPLFANFALCVLLLIALVSVTVLPCSTRIRCLLVSLGVLVLAFSLGWFVQGIRVGTDLQCCGACAILLPLILASVCLSVFSVDAACLAPLVERWLHQRP